ncbi:MAG: hypothetical protein OXG44_09140, partial [Gammaproteobacteria bacterium]|nr:hypothetical protein [Gammaproteobacteria bacterium]
MDLTWTKSDLHERFRKWGTAEETADDEGVRIPEVRVILKYEVTHGVEDPATVQVDVPMWRTSNVMNKMHGAALNWSRSEA